MTTVNFQPKTFPILYPSLENSITGIAIQYHHHKHLKMYNLHATILLLWFCYIVFVTKMKTCHFYEILSEYYFFPEIDLFCKLQNICIKNQSFFSCRHRENCSYFLYIGKTLIESSRCRKLFMNWNTCTRVTRSFDPWGKNL